MMHMAKDFDFVQLTKNTPLLPFVSEDEHTFFCTFVG